MTGTRPAIVHGSFIDPASVSHATSLEEQQAEFEQRFSQLRRYFDANSEIYANFRRANRQSPTDLRIVSPAGLHELSAVGLSPRSDSIPSMVYVPPKDGGLSRPRARDPKRSADSVFQVCLHSFGGAVDIAMLGAGAARSIPVDAATGYSPVRLVNGLGEFVKGSRGVGIHHLISRRGDIFNSSSWTDIANHAGGPVCQSTGARPNLHSIGIELEEWFVRHGGPGSAINLVYDRVPYTEEQLAALAFIVKKLNLWTSGAVTLKWLGPDQEAVQAVLANAPGFFNHTAFNPQHGDPEGEWELPQGWKLGDAFPARWAERRAVYQKRLDLYYGNYAQGTVISMWDRLFDKVARIRDFNATTELFDTDLAAAPNLIEIPTIANAGAVASTAQAAARNQISQIQRSQSMQTVSRTGLYSSAQAQNSAVAAAFAQHAAQMLGATRTTTSAPIVNNALAFDFATGLWVAASTTTAAPDIATAAGGSRVPDAVITPLRVGVPQNTRRYRGATRTETGLEPSPEIATVLNNLALANPSVPKAFIYAMAEKESGFYAGALYDTVNHPELLRPGNAPEISVGLFQINIRPDKPGGQQVLRQLAHEGKTVDSLKDAEYNAYFWMKYKAKGALNQDRVKNRTGKDKYYATRMALAGVPRSKFNVNTVLLQQGTDTYDRLTKRISFVDILNRWISRFGGV